MTDADPQSALPDDASTDDLAGQIDDLLREVASGTVSDEPAAADPVTDDDAAAEADDPLADQIQEMLDEAKQAQAVTAAAEPVGAGPTIEQLDSQLASEADDPVDDPMPTVSLAGAGTPEPVTVDAAAPDADDADLIDDDCFASPDEVMEEPEELPAAAAFATAEDVAAELDTQPEQVSVAAGPPPVAGHVSPASEAPPSAGQARGAAVVVSITCEQVRRLCALVNRPIGRLAPSQRDAVGVVGLTVMAWGGFLLIYSVLF